MTEHKSQKCEFCDYKTNNSSHMKQHKADKHDIDVVWYYCDHCEYKCKRVGSLKTHKAFTHDINVVWYYCDHCDYKTKSYDNLKKHKSTIPRRPKATLLILWNNTSLQHKSNVHKMKCIECESNNILYEEAFIICGVCGYSLDNIDTSRYEFSVIDFQYEYERKTEKCIKAYFENLKISMPEHYHDGIEEILRKVDLTIQSFDDTLKFEILKEIWNFMKRENIPICIETHQKLLEINSKKFGIFLKENSFGHFATIKQKNQTNTDYNMSCIENIIKRIQSQKSPKRSIDDDSKEKILNLSTSFYTKLNDTSLKNEGETVLSLISVYLSLEKLNIKYSMKDFCENSQLTSTPTLSKILKKYKVEICKI